MKRQTVSPSQRGASRRGAALQSTTIRSTTTTTKCTQRTCTRRTSRPFVNQTCHRQFATNAAAGNATATASKAGASTVNTSPVSRRTSARPVRPVRRGREHAPQPLRQPTQFTDGKSKQLGRAGALRPPGAANNLSNRSVNIGGHFVYCTVASGLHDASVSHIQVGKPSLSVCLPRSLCPSVLLLTRFYSSCTYVHIQLPGCILLMHIQLTNHAASSY